jgi:hypothetical protein
MALVYWPEEELASETYLWNIEAIQNSIYETESTPNSGNVF